VKSYTYRPLPSMAMGARERAKNTSHNRTVCVPPPSAAPGFHSPRSAAPPTAHSTHIFAGLQTYGLLIRPAKTSHTAGTINAWNCSISIQSRLSPFNGFYKNTS
jgi:hypothetical protein